MNFSIDAGPYTFPLYEAPDHGIRYDVKDHEKAIQVLQVDLARETIQDMQKASRAGKPMFLGFGKHLYLRYGTVQKSLQSKPARFRDELYKLQEQDTPKQHLLFQGLISHSLAVDRTSNEAASDAAVSNAALDRMREQYAAMDKEKKAHQTEFLNSVVDPKRRRVLANTTPRSTPQVRQGAVSLRSSAVSPPPSMSSVTPQKIDANAEAHRFVLLHLLAISPMSDQDMHKKTAIPLDAIRNLLGRYGEKNESGSVVTWSLIPRRFKELDVYRFPYSNEEDRNVAIENAVRALDKLRLDPADKAWQLLLPREKRNKGIVLSRASLWPTDHRKILGNIEGSRTPQPNKQTDPVQTKDALSDNDSHSGPPVRKPAKSTSRATARTPTSTNPKGKKAGQALSSERIDDSDEEFQQAIANDTASQSATDMILKETSPKSTPAKKPTSKSQPPKPVMRVASPTLDSTVTKKRKLPSSDVASTSIKTASVANDVPKTTLQRPGALPEAKRVKTESGPPKPGAKSVNLIASPKKPGIMGTSINSSKAPNLPPGPQASNIVRKVSKAESSSTASTPSHQSKSSVDSSKATASSASSVSNGLRNGVKSESTFPQVPSPSTAANSVKAPGDLLKRYNDLVKDYNALSVESSRKRTLVAEIRALKLKMQRNSDADAIASARNESSGKEPYSRRRALEAYGQYHKIFQQYCAWKAKPSSDKSSGDRQRDHDKFARLAELQKDVLHGFEAILDSFLTKPKGRVFLRDRSEMLSEGDAEVQTWKARAKFLEWKSKYENMRNHLFGDMEPDQMRALWDELESIQNMRDRVFQSVALSFGRKDEGRLDDVELERVFGG